MQWISTDVIEDQSVGLCIREESGTSKVSCWEAIKSDDSNTYSGYIYYLIDRDEVSANASRLREAGGIYYGDILGGYLGRWTCDSLPSTMDPPNDLLDSTVCRRFLPDSRYVGDDDPRFDSGESLYV